MHVPFCGRRCSYCDFSIAVRREIPVHRFNNAILAEIVTRGIGAQESPLRSLYFGGGTPSKLGGEGIASLVNAVSRQLGVGKLSTLPRRPEVTVEANPEDILPGTAETWADAGVNRVSLGVQTFNGAALQWMHREHGVDQVELALGRIRAAGIENVSVDLIFSLPEKLDRDFGQDLDKVIDLAPSHVSLYGLTIEPKTPLGRWTARGEVLESPEERYEEEFLEAHGRLTAAGFEHYEVSNYGRPGLHAVHNSAYWSGVPYLGLGPSAHGFDGHRRRWNRAGYADWLAAVESGQDPMEGDEILDNGARVAEDVYLGLRTQSGLSIRQNEVLMVTSWVEQGWGVIDEMGVLRLLPAGWLRMDSLAATLIAERQRA